MKHDEAPLQNSPVRVQNCVEEGFRGPQINRNGFQYILSGDLLVYLSGGLYKPLLRGHRSNVVS